MNTPKPNVSVKNKNYKTVDITEEYLESSPKQAQSDINEAYVVQVSIPARDKNESEDACNVRIEEGASSLLEFQEMTESFAQMNAYKGSLRTKYWDDGGVTLSITQGQPKSFSMDALRRSLESTV